MAEIRARVSDQTRDQLAALRSHLRLVTTGQALTWLISDAYQRLLARTRWEQQQQHAYNVLLRLKPRLLIQPAEITGVQFVDFGERVLIHVALNSAPYQVSKKEWER